MRQIPRSMGTSWCDSLDQGYKPAVDVPRGGRLPFLCGLSPSRAIWNPRGPGNITVYLLEVKLWH